MKKVKIAFWIVILVLFGLLVYQNQGFFLNKHSLALNLFFTAGQTIPFYNLVIIVAFFAFGLLIAYTSSLFERYKANKTIKELRANIQSLQNSLDQMKKDVHDLKAPSSSAERPVSADTAGRTADQEPAAPPREV